MSSKIKYSKLKKLSIVLLSLIVMFFCYVVIINRNSVHMTNRQKLLKAIYPALMWWNKLTGTNAKTLAGEKANPPVSFYSLNDTAINGSVFPLANLRGKKVLIVNTASDCGYTNQYADLEKLYKTHEKQLVVIGFPANDFKEQEKGSDEEIASFCKVNFGVSFPLMKKSSVIKGTGQNPVFTWLTSPAMNGWNSQPPTWNFCKYLVDENGRLTDFFGSSVEPFSDELVNAIKK
jgi:glutathione peroxidase